MPDVSIVTPKVPARLRRLISVDLSLKAVNSKKKGVKRAKTDCTSKE
jgi:hypothetical protein